MHPPIRAGLLALAGLAVAITLVAADDTPTVVKVNRLSAAAPAGWKAEKPANRLRSFQFKLPGAGGHPVAELTVMPESSPDAEKNFPRWKAQFVPPEGKTLEEVSKTSKLELTGATANILDVSGTWRYRERPFDPKSKEELKENYRVVWVIVADKDEATHIRLAGPKPTVDRHYAEFEAWLRSLK
jgi:hypothetical protein